MMPLITNTTSNSIHWPEYGYSDENVKREPCLMSNDQHILLNSASRLLMANSSGYSGAGGGSGGNSSSFYDDQDFDSDDEETSLDESQMQASFGLSSSGGSTPHHTHSKKPKTRWSKEEDELLNRLCEQYGPSPKDWKLIATHFVQPPRTEYQCQQRWQKVLNPDLIKGKLLFELFLNLITINN